MRYLLLVCFAVTIASCGNNQAKTEVKTEAKVKPTPVSKLDSAGTVQVNDLLVSYYGLKNALVKDNKDLVKSTSEELNKKAVAFKNWIVGDTAHKNTVSANLDTIIKSANYITHLYPESLVEVGRIEFGKISDNMYVLLQKVELKNVTVYHEYCPMAFNEKGAFWLSEKAEIENPYFGKKMLDCGEVKDSL